MRSSYTKIFLNSDLEGNECSADTNRLLMENAHETMRASSTTSSWDSEAPTAACLRCACPCKSFAAVAELSRGLRGSSQASVT